MGIGVSSGLFAPHLLAQGEIPPVHKYKGIASLADATNKNGELAMRLALSNATKDTKSAEIKLKISGQGVLSRIKNYFLEPPYQITPNQDGMIASLHPEDTDVMLAWIKEATEKTEVSIKLGKEKWKLRLGELLTQSELKFGENTLTVNLLGYTELGRLNLSQLGIVESDRFRFAIMADPQGGNPAVSGNEAPTRMKIHNAFIEDTVKRINELEPAPLFTLILGDFVDSKGQEGNFLQMEELVKPLKMPVLLEVGNHESPYGADFSPGYNMASLDNFFSSQKRVNGTDKMVYSFDLGKWHFVVWPDPLRSNFWVNHPHYFDWLEQDLEENKRRPVIFMHHVPLHPIGIDPLTSYVESIAVKSMLIAILTKHGNVKYAFSGHVHIPLKASLKTAVNYKGINMINLSAAGFRARAFGEEDFFGGPEQGVCILDIDDMDVSIHFQHVTKEWFTYPQEFPKFDSEKYALWFNQPWELPLRPKIENGNFELGLRYWHPRYVHHEDENPSNIREIRAVSDSKKALYLYTRKRGYDVPGQDRLPQHINRLAQAVTLKELSRPVLKFSYWPEENHFDPSSLNGFFLWIQCFHKSRNVANLVYSVGKVYSGITKGFGQKGSVGDYHFDLPSEVGKWHEVTLPFATDFETVSEEGASFEKLKADRAVLYLGVWTVNEGIDQEAGITVADLVLEEGNDATKGTALKSEDDIWHMKIDHIAGDHQYTDQEMVYPKGLQGKLKPLS